MLKFFLIVFASISLCLSNLYSQTNSNDIVHSLRIDQGLQSPTRIAIDDNDNIYVTDYDQKSIVKYNALGNYIETINTGFVPLSIAINDANQVFVGTKEGGTIYKLENNGSLTEFYSACIMPSSMAFSPEGVLYVVDSEQKMVIVIDKTGSLVNTIGLGNLIFPSSIAYDSRNSRIFVGEHGGIGSGFSPTCKVWIYDLAGTSIGSFGSHGNTNGKFYRIQGVTIGKCGNIYVNEPFQAKITVFDESLNFLTKFGYYGSQIGELNVPLDIAFDSQERILLTSNNNSSVEVFTVTDTLPTSNIANSDASICTGQTTDILIDFTGTAPWAFTISIDGVNQTPITTSDNPYTLTVSTAGIYEVNALTDLSKTGTCFSGSATISTTGPIPSSNISTGNIAICDGLVADIPVDFTGTAPWTYTYTIDGINPTTIITNNNPYIISTVNAGLYEVQTVSDAGCTGIPTGTSDVTINTVPSANITALNSVICDGQATNLTIDLTGTPPYTFTYDLDGLNPITINTLNNTYVIPASTAGTYSVTSVMDAQCTDATIQGFVELIVNPLPTAIIDNITEEICDGGFFPIPVQLTGTAPFTLTYQIEDSLFYTLTNIYSSPYIYAAQSGTYTINQISDANCMGNVTPSSAEIIIIPSAISDFMFSQNGLDVSFINTSLNANSYLWDFGDATTSTDIDPIHVYTSSGLYQVNLTATNQCNDSSVTSQTIDMLVLVENFDLNSFVKLYPNPTAGTVTVEIQNATQADISIDITSLNGQIVYSKEFANPNIIENIDLSIYSNGVYTVRIVSDEFTKTSKLILNK